jgi:hypothetical protein
VSLWKRATDLTSLRRWTRYAAVAALAAVLVGEVTTASAQIPPVPTIPGIPCVDRCARAKTLCDQLCNSQQFANIALCAANEAICEYNCVLNGFLPPVAFAQCRAGCLTAQATCNAGVTAIGNQCRYGCFANNEICKLLCALFPGLV